jgi:hypothetical protein
MNRNRAYPPSLHGGDRPKPHVRRPLVRFAAFAALALCAACSGTTQGSARVQEQLLRQTCDGPVPVRTAPSSRQLLQAPVLAGVDSIMQAFGSIAAEAEPDDPAPVWTPGVAVVRAHVDDSGVVRAAVLVRSTVDEDRTDRLLRAVCHTRFVPAVGRLELGAGSQRAANTAAWVHLSVRWQSSGELEIETFP